MRSEGPAFACPKSNSMFRTSTRPRGIMHGPGTLLLLSSCKFHLMKMFLTLISSPELVCDRNRWLRSIVVISTAWDTIYPFWMIDVDRLMNRNRLNPRSLSVGRVLLSSLASNTPAASTNEILSALGPAFQRRPPNEERTPHLNHR